MKNKIITLLGLSFILLGCSTNKVTQSSNNNSSSENKITVVSEQEFVAEASKIEKHYYESATVDYSRVITTREDSSLEDEVFLLIYILVVSPCHLDSGNRIIVH